MVPSWFSVKVLDFLGFELMRGCDLGLGLGFSLSLGLGLVLVLVF